MEGECKEKLYSGNPTAGDSSHDVGPKATIIDKNMNLLFILIPIALLIVSLLAFFLWRRLKKKGQEEE